MTTQEFVDTMCEMHGFGRLPARVAMRYAIDTYNRKLPLMKQNPNHEWRIVDMVRVPEIDRSTFRRYYKSMTYALRKKSPLEAMAFMKAKIDEYKEWRKRCQQTQKSPI